MSDVKGMKRTRELLSGLRGVIRRPKFPLLLKEGKARSAGVVLKEPRSAPIKECCAGNRCSFASLQDHPTRFASLPSFKRRGVVLTPKEGLTASSSGKKQPAIRRL